MIIMQKVINQTYKLEISQINNDQTNLHLLFIIHQFYQLPINLQYYIKTYHLQIDKHLNIYNALLESSWFIVRPLKPLPLDIYCFLDIEYDFDLALLWIDVVFSRILPTIKP